MINKKVIKDIESLQKHIKSAHPSFYFSSQTSTVIPYDKIESTLDTDNDYYLCDLSQMPKSMKILENGNLKVEGAVSWKEAREFLIPKGKTIKTAPTEELALITAGAATSCTGERCFHFGNLRSQIHNITYVNHKGETQVLSKDKPFPYQSDRLKVYQQEFKLYENYKNAPYPRFETETDLLIGTEGQLGVITEIEIEICDDEAVTHLFILLPKWEENPQAHMEIIKKVQAFKNDIILCELIDSNAFSFLSEEDRPNKGLDAIFLEIKSSSFDKVYEEFIFNLSCVNQEEIFELNASKFHNLRASIPRAVFEENSRMGVTKMGTDVQVKIEDFEALLAIYQSFSKLGVRYNLFGHFGDAHLHFNFMPKNEDISKCQDAFQNMYKEVAKLKGSPFAEHGIGIIKQKFIKEFWSKNQIDLFQELKQNYDPKNQFFPQGFMNLR